MLVISEQKSPRSDNHTLDSCKRSSSTGEEEFRSPSTDTLEIYINSSDITANKDMCANSSPRRDSYVYKRRKLHRNTLALLTEEKSVKGSMERSGGYHSNLASKVHPSELLHEDVEKTPICTGSGDTLCNGNPLISRCHHQQQPNFDNSQNIGDRDNIPLENAGTNNRGSVKEDEVPAEPFVDHRHNTSMKDVYLTPKTTDWSVSKFMMAKVVDNGDCSSSDIVVAGQLQNLLSAKERCMAVLKSHGLLGGKWTSGSCASLEVLDVAGDNNCSQLCKVCGRLEKTAKLIICDLCEEAFHRSCCIPRVRKIPVDEWYCQSCSPKKRNTALNSCAKKSSDIGPESKHPKSASHGSLDPISSMLRDTEPYTSGARIGKNFQAEVSEWSGPVLDDNKYIDEHMELDPAKCASLNHWSFGKPSVGNWIQCRETIYKDGNHTDEGTICGKWRRAPLFEVQTEDWDCSCALPWDPIHADCAVPQELETEIVLKHLKYVEALKPRLVTKQKADQTKSECSQVNQQL